MRKKTIEDYVELIYILEKKKKKVHTNDVANIFNISPASVTEIFQKLSDEDYIVYEKYSGVRLTTKGKKIAVETKRKHDTLKSFLMILGVSEDIADEDACKIEHITNPETMKRFTKFVEFVQKFNQEPKWLTRFQHYYSTGEYLPCLRLETIKKKVQNNKN
jgi:DtxR family Mn-dependent transcriptional regulator